jgi:hypothetical protein
MAEKAVHITIAVPERAAVKRIRILHAGSDLQRNERREGHLIMMYK